MSMYQRFFVANVLFGTVFFSCVLIAQPITNITLVEELCREQSEEMLSEQGLQPSQWRAQNHNNNATFNVEGRWKALNGIYVAECELRYGGEAENLLVTVTKE